MSFPRQFADDCKATCNTVGPSDATLTGVTVTSGTWPTPGNPFLATLFDGVTYATPLLDPAREVVEVTAIAGGTWSITRAQDGTSALAHSNATLWLVLVSQDLNDLTAAIVDNLLTAAIGTTVPQADYSAFFGLNFTRLSLDSVLAVPVDTGSPLTSATLRLNTYFSDNAGVYSQGLVQTASPTLAAPSPDGMYDVFLDGNGNLQAVQWYSSTQRSSGGSGSLLQVSNGVVNSTVLSIVNAYVGTVYVQGGLFEDDASARYVWNYRNRVARSLVADVASASSSSTTWSTACSAAFVVGFAEDVVLGIATAYATGDSGSGALCEVAASIAATPDGNGGYAVALAATSVSTATAAQAPEGLNSLNLLMRSSIATDTVTLSSPDTWNANAVRGVLYG